MQSSTQKRHPSAYKHIQAWGLFIGSNTAYINRQQEEASDDGAPLDAIYKDRETGEWKTVAIIKSTDRLDLFNRILNNPGKFASAQ